MSHTVVRFIKRATLVMLPLTPLLAHAQSFSSSGANEYVRRQDWNGLLRYANAWTHAKPNDEMGWYYLGNTYGIGLKNPAPAVTAFQRAVSIKSNWPQAWNALGHVLIDVHRTDEAANAFATAAKQAPQNAGYWNSLAAAYSYSNRISKVVDALEAEQRAMGARMTAAEWYMLANGFITMEEFKSASNAYRQALRLNPNFAEAWNNLGTLEQSTGNNSAALQDYQRAAQLGNGNGTNNYRRLQNALTASQQTHTDNPLRQLEISVNKELAYRARLAWEDKVGRAQTNN